MYARRVVGRVWLERGVSRKDRKASQINFSKPGIVKQTTGKSTRALRLSLYPTGTILQATVLIVSGNRSLLCSPIRAIDLGRAQCLTSQRTYHVIIYQEYAQGAWKRPE